MADYDYSLPPGAVAQTPIEPRDAARLLVSLGGEVLDRHVRDLPDLLEPGDLVVVNDTRVLPARLRLHKTTGGRVEVLLLEPCGQDWSGLVRPGRRVAPGTLLVDGSGRAIVEVGEALDPDGIRRVRLLCQLGELGDVGEVPLPPYIHERLEDPERYQTVYAARPASVAAPTAGLHLTADVIERCRSRGVGFATVELVVGLDTFRPITADDPADHRIHTESYAVSPATWERCRSASGRVVAVGTTTVRALEACAATGCLQGRTDLFIRPGFQFAVVDVLMTNFHLPRSSLLLLVDAFTGGGWHGLYTRALQAGYRFLSFGDAMLVACGSR